MWRELSLLAAAVFVTVSAILLMQSVGVAGA